MQHVIIADLWRPAPAGLLFITHAAGARRDVWDEPARVRAGPYAWLDCLVKRCRISLTGKMDIERRLVREPLLGVDRNGAFARVPSEALVLVLGAADHEFTEIEWNRSVLRVFTADLIQRTEVIVHGSTGKPH
jgi:hypothetical protein